MELVWGPELSYTESNSQVYKFLGSEKYTSVLNSIYAGLGVPPTLTGAVGQSGGFTNNFISLKTLVERLQYGRDQLAKFWEAEIEYIRKAMGFRKPAHITFDQMSLSDESAEKNLLIQLADRDIISHETILERFKEIPSVEKMRLKREQKDRVNPDLPDKASPFHNANHKQDMEKIDRQGELNKQAQESKQTPKNDNGRPPLKQDDGPRKKRVDTPRSKPGVAELVSWTSETFDVVSDTINKAYLAINAKKNLRQLTKDQICDLENLKVQTLASLEILKDVDETIVAEAINNIKNTPIELKNLLKTNKVSASELPINSYKKKLIGVYVEYLLGQF
jgi:hypothetical protein